MSSHPPPSFCILRPQECMLTLRYCNRGQSFSAARHKLHAELIGSYSRVIHTARPLYAIPQFVINRFEAEPTSGGAKNHRGNRAEALGPSGVLSFSLFDIGLAVL